MIQSLYISQNTSVLIQVSNLYGTLDYIADFLALNPMYGILDEIMAGTTIYYDLSVIVPIQTVTQITTPPNQTAPTPINVLGQYRQSIFDIITRFNGNLNYLALFLAANPQMEAITEYADGNIYSITPNLTNNVSQFNLTNEVFATFDFAIGKSYDYSYDSSYD